MGTNLTLKNLTTRMLPKCLLRRKKKRRGISLLPTLGPNSWL